MSFNEDKGIDSFLQFHVATVTSLPLIYVTNHITVIIRSMVC